MNVPLVVAGALALTAAGVHGIVGEALVVTKLSPEKLPSSPFGGPKMTKTMIRAAWHIATIAFLTVAAALVLAGAALSGDASRDLGLVGAASATAIGALILVLGARVAQPGRSPFLHPAPALVTALVALAWWGAL